MSYKIVQVLHPCFDGAHLFGLNAFWQSTSVILTVLPYACEISWTRLRGEPIVVTAKEVWVGFTVFLKTWCEEEGSCRGEVSQSPGCDRKQKVYSGFLTLTRPTNRSLCHTNSTACAQLSPKRRQRLKAPRRACAFAKLVCRLPMSGGAPVEIYAASSVFCWLFSHWARLNRYPSSMETFADSISRAMVHS